MSKWFVGSSRSSKCGVRVEMVARTKRAFSPPERLSILYRLCLVRARIGRGGRELLHRSRPASCALSVGTPSRMHQGDRIGPARSIRHQVSMTPRMAVNLFKLACQKPQECSFAVTVRTQERNSVVHIDPHIQVPQNGRLGLVSDGSALQYEDRRRKFGGLWELEFRRPVSSDRGDRLHPLSIFRRLCACRALLAL